MSRKTLSIGQLATLACTLEVTIPKPGNVHRSADFADLTLQDLLLSAIAIGPAMDRARNSSLGDTVYDAIQATQNVVATNSNLGLVLLLAPLASVTEFSTQTISQFLAGTSFDDCKQIYAAIRQANPGGMGSVDEADLSGEPDSGIIESMTLAADRDLIAQQYSNGFKELLEFVVPELKQSADRMPLPDAVIWTHLRTMNEFPDSLISRKNGPEIAHQSAALAGRVLASKVVSDDEYLRELSDFDFWLRSDGHRRNPGTTADLIGAALFVCLRRETIRLNRGVQ